MFRVLSIFDRTEHSVVNSKQQADTKVEHLILEYIPVNWGWGERESADEIEFPDCFTENLISRNTPRMTLIARTAGA